MKVGYTTGVFDLFHVGHLRILMRAKEQCDHLIVGVTTDELAASRKGARPVIPFEERMAIVEGIRFVDQVVPQSCMDKMQAWSDLRFNVMFVGDDWKGTPAWLEWERRFKDIGVDILYFPYTEGTSSTKLRHVLQRLIDQGGEDRPTVGENVLVTAVAAPPET